MARAGWYPDPGGAPDRFRHWDGRRWSDQTTADPTDPAPSTSASSEPPTRNPRRSLILIAVVLALVVVVIGVLVVRSALGEGPSAAPAVPSAPGRDDASPGSAAGSPTESAQQEAERIIGCELRSDLDQDLKITDVEKLDEGKIQVDGKPAVDLRVRVAVSNLPVGARGFVYNVIVVPGPGDDSFFIGEIPYPDNRRVSVMDTTVAGLSLS